MKMTENSKKKKKTEKRMEKTVGKGEIASNYEQFLLFSLSAFKRLLLLSHKIKGLLVKG